MGDDLHPPDRGRHLLDHPQPTRRRERHDPVHAGPDRRLGPRRVLRSLRAGGRHHGGRREGLLHRSRPPGRPARPSAQARRRTRRRRRRWLPHDPRRLAAPRHLHPRLREAGHRRCQRHGGRRRDAPRLGLRPGGDGGGGKVRGGLHPARHRTGCRRGVDPHPPGRHPEGKGAVLLRRRRPGGRGLPYRPGQPSRATRPSCGPPSRRWPNDWPPDPPRPSGSPSG